LSFSSSQHSSPHSIPTLIFHPHFPYIKQAIMQSQQVGCSGFSSNCDKTNFGHRSPPSPSLPVVMLESFPFLVLIVAGMLWNQCFLMSSNPSFIFRSRTTSPLIMSSGIHPQVIFCEGEVGGRGSGEVEPRFSSSEIGAYVVRVGTL